jgi:hypothetical protein
MLLLSQWSRPNGVDLVRDRHDRFQRIFVCPAESRATFHASRRLVAVDGTFLKARFILTLLVAVGINANAHAAAPAASLGIMPGLAAGLIIDLFPYENRGNFQIGLGRVT